MGGLDGNDWPVMEEEILVVEDSKGTYFNFPYSLYKRRLEKELSKLQAAVRVKEDRLGGKRAEVFVDKQTAEEIKAWLTVTLSELSKKYFITELEVI